MQIRPICGIEKVNCSAWCRYACAVLSAVLVLCWNLDSWRREMTEGSIFTILPRIYGNSKTKAIEIFQNNPWTAIFHTSAVPFNSMFRVLWEDRISKNQLANVWRHVENVMLPLVFSNTGKVIQIKQSTVHILLLTPTGCEALCWSWRFWWLTGDEITADENWVHHNDPDRKRGSMEFRYKGSSAITWLRQILISSQT